ncbi:MAG: spore cortex-lytic enzyme [Christensenellales bacterium]|jgi:N-acetylmuramoyl-L-alanine amidase
MKRRWILMLLTVATLALCLMEMPARAKPIVLGWGDSGDNVKKVQSRLKQWGYYDGPVDGIFGSETYEAVRLFQRRNGLVVDGKVGDQTAAAIGITLSGKSYTGSGGGAASGDLYLLACAVHAEARGEPYTGMVAVAAVILNRVKSPLFPNTIAGVIYQPGAFSTVSDGSINLPPNEQSIRAARDALNGWDPSGGSLYFYNPAKSTSRWIYSRRVVTVIGGHRFAV